MRYINRDIEERVKRDLEKKMVFISGPRQSGKTTLAKKISLEYMGERSADFYLNWDATRDREMIIREQFPAGKGLLVLPFQISVAFVLSKTSLNIFFQWGLVGTGIMLTGILAMHLFWLSKEEERQFLQLITGLKNKLRQNALPG